MPDRAKDIDLSFVQATQQLRVSYTGRNLELHGLIAEAGPALRRRIREAP